MHHMKARLLIILSMAIFGTIGLFVRNIPIPSSEIALFRAILASVLLICWLVIRNNPIPFRQIWKEVPFLILSGVAMGFNWILLFEAYKYTTVSLATLSYYFAPVIVTAVCPILFREKLTRLKVICFLMSTLGLVLITGIGDVSGTGTHGKGILLGLGAAVLYACVVITNKFIRHVSGIYRTLLQFLAATAVLLPYVILTNGITFAGMDGKGWACLIILGVLHTGITYCMYFSALRDLPGQEAAILSYVDPLVAVALSVLVLHEAMTPVQMVGGILILGFTLVNEIAGE